MEGLRRRQKEIVQACDKHPDGEVIYIDIKKFYPSITPELAEEAWKSFSEVTGIERIYVELGLKLIDNYKHVTDGKSILTGPMFCHFLANLVLHPIDLWAESLDVSYLRYVDDITLVGPHEDLQSALASLRAKLEVLGFTTHELQSPKTLIVPASEWIESAGDFRQGVHSVAWMRLIGDIKRLLLFRSENARGLSDGLLAEGFRLPILDYAVAVGEATAFQRVRQLGLWGWLRIKTERVSISSVIDDARKLSMALTTETRKLLASGGDASPFQRKRLISKLRFRLGRLVYLGKESELQKLVPLAREWPELAFHAEILGALLTKDCWRVAHLGSNAAQATAQVFRISLETALFSQPVTTEAETQSLAVFLLNGIPVDAQVKSPDHPLLRFARGPIDEDLMRMPRGLV
jgi:hypothetical protein